MPNSKIIGTGSYIPSVKIPNSYFLENEFYSEDGKRIEKANEEVVKKLYEITGIKERRYVPEDMNTSDMAYESAKQALENIDRETLDCIIVGQNLGDVKPDNIRTEMVPSIASRVKHKLKIKNPYTVAYDVPFGCPGWLNGMILADYHIKSGDAKRILVIGAEILSRVSDPHDVDCMIFSDGAGATLVEATEEDVGMLAHVTRTDAIDHAYLLWIGESYNPNYPGDELFIKMDGHEIYKYALRTVPKVVQKCLDKVGMTLSDVKKVLIHQANEKMDEAILKRIFNLYNIKEIPEHIMPMTISWLGNSSVATLPTMFDLIQRGKMENHQLLSGDIALFASIGAGMNINAMVYRMP